MNLHPRIDPDDLPPFMLVWGNNDYLRGRCLTYMRDRLRDTHEIHDVWCEKKTKSYEVVNEIDRQVLDFDGVEKRAVFVWDFQRVDDRDKYLLPYLDNPVAGTFVVFVLSQGSRAAGKLLKRLKGGLNYQAVHPVVDWRTDEVTPWIQGYLESRGLMVDYALCRALLDNVGPDLFALESEMRCILTYCEGRQSAGLDDFKAVVTPRVHADFRDLKQSVLKRDLKQSMLVVHEMMLFGEEVIPTIAALMLAFRQWSLIFVLHKAAKMPLSDVALEIGLPPYVVEKKLWPHLAKYRKRDISRLLDLEARCCSIDYMLKVGAIDGPIALELLVMEACGVNLGRIDYESRYPV